MSKRIDFQLKCKFSGLAIGSLSYMTVAGHMPYLSHWDKMVALHPVFSMPTHKLLAYVRGEWERLGSKAADEEISEAEASILQVGFLAVLHSFQSVQQEIPALPPLHIVQSHMSKLFALAYWHHYLESKRFKFPAYKINKLNENASFEYIHDYLEVCFSIKSDYEKNVREADEKAKAQSAEKAMAALRDSWIVPPSKKLLYKWIRAHLPAKYEAEAQGWMSTLFLGNDRTILDFDIDETELLEEIIVSECPAGTGIMKACRDRLAHILKVQRDNKEAFSVDFSDYLEPTPEAKLIASQTGKALPTLLQVEPLEKDFPSKVLFIRAKASWYLQQSAIREQQAAQAKKPHSTF
jgi:hypothetical protein